MSTTPSVRPISVVEAKQTILHELMSLEIPFERLSARTVSFEDLARERCIFVCIHGWRPNAAWDHLKRLAAKHGFRVETDGDFS